MANLLCRWFGHKPVFRLYSVFAYAMMLACSADMEKTPHGKTVCARCGADLPAGAAGG